MTQLICHSNLPSKPAVYYVLSAQDQLIITRCFGFAAEVSTLIFSSVYPIQGANTVPVLFFLIPLDCCTVTRQVQVCIGNGNKCTVSSTAMTLMHDIAGTDASGSRIAHSWAASVTIVASCSMMSLHLANLPSPSRRCIAVCAVYFRMDGITALL
jgi:hypothetical protein